jgi:hypothetical protein
MRTTEHFLRPLGRLLLALPVIGFTLRMLADDDPRVVLGFLANLLMAAILAVLVWGYPVFIVIALAAAALALATVLALTFG